MLLTLARNRAIELVSKKLDKTTETKPRRSVKNIQMEYVSTLVLSKYKKKRKF